MHRFTFVRVIVPESIFFDTQACTPDWSCCREKYPWRRANSRPTNHVTRATALEVSGSYRHAFFRSSVLRISDEERGGFCPDGPEPGDEDGPVDGLDADGCAGREDGSLDIGPLPLFGGCPCTRCPRLLGGVIGEWL